MKSILLLTGGLYSLAFAVFHMLFWRVFRWKADPPAADSGQSSDHPGAESSVDICVLGHGARDSPIPSCTLINGSRDVHSWGGVAFLVHAGDRTDHIFRPAQRSVNSTLLGVSDWQWTICDTRFHVGRASAPSS